MKNPDGHTRAFQKGDHPSNILQFAGGRAEEVLRRLSERHRCTTHLPRNHVLAGWEAWEKRISSTISSRQYQISKQHE